LVYDLRRIITLFRMNRGINSAQETGLIHDKSDRKSGTAPPRLLGLRDGIFLQS
jgi:hypothetical protein